MIIYPAVSDMDDAAHVRADEALDWARLTQYLREHLSHASIPGLDLSRGMDIAQFPGGHSNLTYLIRFGGTSLVLRRPPLGPVAPTAHDMAREFRWLSAIHDVFPLAPRAYHLCDDAGVIGAVFYVMERRHGTIVRRSEPDMLAGNPDGRRRLNESLLDTLAALHRIDVSTPPLAGLGKPAGFMARQLRGWTERWRRSQTDQLPEVDSIIQWLTERLPPDPSSPAVVHGDFKLDNLMIADDDPSKIVAVLDWEMSALGDPLADLGILLAYWSPTAPPDFQDALTPVTDRPGWMSADEIVARYALLSGRDVSAIAFYEISALFKVAVVIQQIYYRYRQGQTADSRFARFDARVAYLARRALARAEQAG